MEECRWFFGCHNDAEFLVEHPTLGEVPTCAEHVAWLTRDPSPTKMVPPMVAAKMAGMAARLAAPSEPEPVGPVGTVRHTIR